MLESADTDLIDGSLGAAAAVEEPPPEVFEKIPIAMQNVVPTHLTSSSTLHVAPGGLFHFTGVQTVFKVSANTFP